MKFQAYDEKQEQTPDVYLRVINGGKYAYLVACNQRGEVYRGGRILRIGEEGALELCSNLNPSLGFKLDDRGQIAQSKDF